MAGLSRARSRRFGRRAQAVRAEKNIRLPVADGGWGRFLAVYVLDLLSARDAKAAVAEASRLTRRPPLPVLRTVTRRVQPGHRQSTGN
jgi:hypothetical protein